jgi:hypothetical protein
MFLADSVEIEMEYTLQLLCEGILYLDFESILVFEHGVC